MDRRSPPAHPREAQRKASAADAEPLTGQIILIARSTALLHFWMPAWAIRFRIPSALLALSLLWVQSGTLKRAPNWNWSAILQSVDQGMKSLRLATRRCLANWCSKDKPGQHPERRAEFLRTHFPRVAMT